MTQTLKELRKEYREELGRSPKGLTREQMAKELLANAERKDRQMQREAQEEAENQARIARAQSRSEESLKELCDFSRSDDKENLRRYARFVFNSREAFKASKETFLDNLERDPSYAMSWSHSFFKATETLVVAEELMGYMLHGLTSDQITTKLHEQLIRAARSGTSTSPTSNLRDKSRAEALADALDRFF